jgi:cation diffusion facilitator family transporter
MKKNNGSTGVVLAALSANLFIAAAKFLVTLATRSSAMFAEAIHSTADAFNQIFLLIGIKAGARKADELHPFGFSAESYFWSFIVAIFLFTAGAVFSIIEGIHKLLHPLPLKHPYYAYLVLVLSIAAEAASLRIALRKIRNERGNAKIFSFLHHTKKSELIVVFLEDLAAVTGLSIALLFIITEQLTGILIFDGLASVLIGVLLAVIALFLGFETQSLLIGESADPDLLKTIYGIILREENVRRVIHVRSLQMGPEDVLLAVKAEFDERLNSTEISTLINGIEKEIRKEFPEVKKIFIEPDVYRPA